MRGVTNTQTVEVKQSRRYDHLPAESNWNPTLCFLESGNFFLELNTFFEIQIGNRKIFGIRNRILKAIFGIQNGIRWNPK